MCYHRRLLYGACNHSAWLAKVHSCEIEKGFEAGFTDEGCSWMFAHPLKTMRLNRLCPECDAKKTWSDTRLGKIKTLLKGLQEDMTRRQISVDYGWADGTASGPSRASRSGSPGSCGATAEHADSKTVRHTCEVEILTPSPCDNEDAVMIVVSNQILPCVLATTILDALVPRRQTAYHMREREMRDALRQALPGLMIGRANNVTCKKNELCVAGVCLPSLVDTRRS